MSPQFKCVTCASFDRHPRLNNSNNLTIGLCGLLHCFLTREFLSRNSDADLIPVQPEDCKTEIGSRYWGLDPGSSTML